MTTVLFNYEFIFTKGYFDLATYLTCNIIDIIGNRLSIIQNTCTELEITFNKTLGSRIFSTFVKYDNKIYKVTLNNASHI